MKQKKILVLSRYSRLGASSRIRIYQYLPYLEAQGFRVTVAPLLDDNYLESLYAGKHAALGSVLGKYSRRLWHLLNIRRYDLIWIEKELFPFLPPWGEELVSHMGIPYIVDYDDATFHRYDSHPNKIVRFLFGKKIYQVMRRATLVTVGNSYLAERAKQAGAKRVELFPSVIDLTRYPLTSRGKSPIFTIGWVGTPVTASYLNIVRSALAEVCKGGKGRVVLVGSGEIDLHNVPVEIRSWSEGTEVADIHTFDVGIMPLPDRPWERGKCGYKLIQYMACGLPVVASPVGANLQIVNQGENGFLAQTDEEWYEALKRLLYMDPNERRTMGMKGRALVEERYSLQAQAPRFLEALQMAVR